MSALAPALFDRRFDDLIELGRARLQSLAPEWTDYNAHDPGITLVELLAWIAEAQMYSLARMRRDERAAYAALMGLRAGGSSGARGLIWPELDAPNAPANTFARTQVLGADTPIHVADADNGPRFHPTDALMWVPGALRAVATRTSDGRQIDHALTNGSGMAFLPFGEDAGRRDVLRISYTCSDPAGLFGAQRAAARGARLSIGCVAAARGDTRAPARASLTATLIASDRRFPLPITSDSSAALTRTGALLLDLDAVDASPVAFDIELGAARGFPTAPRLSRLALNVLPVMQGAAIAREPHTAPGSADWAFALDQRGLRFSPGEEPVTIESVERDGVRVWRRCEQLSQHGPRDDVFELDAGLGEIRFGNGVNGRIPPEDVQMLASYAVSDGAAGDVARLRSWRVKGIDAVYGVNLDSVSGGTDAGDGAQLRRAARRIARAGDALVTAHDIETAALALTDLEVARAWVAAEGAAAQAPGALTLVALRTRPPGGEPARAPETRRWLEAVRAALAPRVMLGTRLNVVAPRYRTVRIAATIEAAPRIDPSAVRQAATAEIGTRLALDNRKPGDDVRPPGMPVTQRDIAAWLKRLPGVSRIVELRVSGADSRPRSEIVIPRDGLPRWDAAGSAIIVVPAGQQGGAQ